MELPLEPRHDNHSRPGGSRAPLRLQPVTAALPWLWIARPWPLGGGAAGGQVELSTGAGYRAAPAINAATIYVACRSRLPRARSYRIVVRGQHGRRLLAHRAAAPRHQARR